MAYALTPSLYGWFGSWNTTDVPNGNYDLYAVATVNGTSDSSPESTFPDITVDNPPPSVSIGSPVQRSDPEWHRGPAANAPYTGSQPCRSSSTGATGTTYLGESWDPTSGGGSASISIYWNSATVPNGYYVLVAVAESPVACLMPPVSMWQWTTRDRYDGACLALTPVPPITGNRAAWTGTHRKVAEERGYGAVPARLVETVNGSTNTAARLGTLLSVWTGWFRWPWLSGTTPESTP